MSEAKVAVVDYGSGNLRSVGKALERSGMRADVTGDVAAIERADAVVLPGVGAFRGAAQHLREKSLDTAIRRGIEAGKPYLGICLGLQLLFETSEEHGRCEGFGLFKGRVERFPEKTSAGETLRVPHIGWNEVRFCGSHPMLAELPASDAYYFVHSYRPVPEDDGLVVGRADYGAPFAAAIAHDNVFAVQFHPEKSQDAGRRLLDAFARWIARC